ncbi:MAG: RHS repeat protein, partial [Firmicutes bacterium]|nr:RHS repeat protein [Bacillota bacterium]
MIKGRVGSREGTSRGGAKAQTAPAARATTSLSNRGSALGGAQGLARVRARGARAAEWASRWVRHVGGLATWAVGLVCGPGLACGLGLICGLGLAPAQAESPGLPTAAAQAVEPQVLAIAGADTSFQAATPALFAIDGAADTAWWAGAVLSVAQSLVPGPGSGSLPAWLEVRLQTPAFPAWVDLSLAPGAAGVLICQVQQDGRWDLLPGSIPVQLAAHAGGNVRLKLPLFTAPVERLRFCLQPPGGQASSGASAGPRLGGLSEVRVFGYPLLPMAQQVRPSRIEVTAGSDSAAFPAGDLADGNTRTFWEATADAAGQAVVVFSLPGRFALERLQAYGGVQGAAQGRWEYRAGGQWLALPHGSFGTANLARAGWNTWNVASVGEASVNVANVTGTCVPAGLLVTDAVRLVLEADAAGSTLWAFAEVAIWGAPAPDAAGGQTNAGALLASGGAEPTLYAGTGPTAPAVSFVGNLGYRVFPAFPAEVRVDPRQGQGRAAVPIVLPDSLDGVVEARLTLETWPNEDRPEQNPSAGNGWGSGEHAGGRPAGVYLLNGIPLSSLAGVVPVPTGDGEAGERRGDRRSSAEPSRQIEQYRVPVEALRPGINYLTLLAGVEDWPPKWPDIPWPDGLLGHGALDRMLSQSIGQLPGHPESPAGVPPGDWTAGLEARGQFSSAFPTQRFSSGDLRTGANGVETPEGAGWSGASSADSPPGLESPWRCGPGRGIGDSGFRATQIRLELRSEDGRITPVSALASGGPGGMLRQAPELLDGFVSPVWRMESAGGWGQGRGEAGSATVELVLRGRVWPTRLSLLLDEAPPQTLAVSVFDGRTWRAIPGLEAVVLPGCRAGSPQAEPGQFWIQLWAAQPVPAEKLRLRFTRVPAQADSEPGRAGQSSQAGPSDKTRGPLGGGGTGGGGGNADELPLGGVADIQLWGVTETSGPPQITVSAPQPWQTVQSPVTVAGTVDDTASRVMVDGRLVTLEGHRFTAQVSLPGSGRGSVPHVLQIQAVNPRGQRTSADIPVYASPGPAQIELESPRDWEQTAGDAIEVQGHLSAPALLVLVNGQIVRPQEPGQRFTAQVPLAEGLNVIWIWSLDQRGELDWEILRVIRDSQTPQLCLEMPSAAALLRTTPDVFTGLVGDLTPVSAALNGLAAKPAGGGFAVEGVRLATGPNRLSLTGTDSLGHFAAVDVPLLLDDAPPAFRDLQPLAGAVVNHQPVTFSGRMDDATPVQLWVNGTLVPVAEDGRFSTSVALREGANTLTLAALDTAGNRQAQEHAVMLDTQPPALFVPELSPASWTATPPVLTFTTTDVPSGVDHYELSVDGGPFAPVVSPYTVKGLADGTHTLQVKAVDRAGWETPGTTVTAYVDTTPPEPFVATAQPASWTQNRQPVLRFATTDVPSGVDHYTVQVDRGPPVAATSPYTLPPQPDGVHTVTVTACDKAGLATSAQVQVFTDTTPPAKLEDVRPVSGPDFVELRWIPSPDPQLSHYIVRRDPAFPPEAGGGGGDISGGEGSGGATGGSARPEITLPLDGASAAGVFRDPAVEPLKEYRYQIAAVDLAGNVGEFNPWQAVTVGYTAVPASPDQPARVEFARVTLQVPAGSLPEGRRVTVASQPATEAPQDDSTVPCGDVYYLNTTARDGTLTDGEAVEFAQPVQSVFRYDPRQIPAGFGEPDLYLYTWEGSAQRWIRVPGQVRNVAENSITAPLTHFSTYSIRASDARPLSAEEFQNLGVAPYQKYFRDNQETISPASGGVTIRATDLFIPGRNGLDLELRRIYDSVGANESKAVAIRGLGGWEWDLPYIASTQAGQFLQLPGGGRYKIDWPSASNNGTQRRVAFSYHKGEHFVLEKLETKDRDILLLWSIPIDAVWNTTGYALNLADGTVWHFDTQGRPTRQLDRTGQNWIDYTFDADGRLLRMADNSGHWIALNYDGSGQLQSATDGRRTVQYRYPSQGGLLSQVVEPKSDRVTAYRYESYSVTSGWSGMTEDESGNGHEHKPSQLSLSLLAEIRYPSGGLSRFTYHAEQTSFWDGNYNIYVYRMLLDSRVKQASSSDPTEYERVRLSYQLAGIEGNPLGRITHTVMDEGQGVRPELPKRRTLLGYNEDNQVVRQEVQDFGSGSARSVETITFEYDSNLRAPTREEHIRSTGTTYVRTFAYDGWGNVLQETNSATGLEIRYRYANGSPAQLGDPFASSPYGTGTNPRIHDALIAKGVINPDPAHGTRLLQQTHYEYDPAGNRIKEAHRYQGRWIETRYEYDAYGNLIRRILPPFAPDQPGTAHVTEYEYSPAYQHAYLTRETEKAVQAAGGPDGSGGALPADLTREYGYDPVTGEKIWEQDGRGKVTSFVYDPVGRVVETVFPDEDDGNLRPGDADWAAARAHNPRQRAEFDDLRNTYTSFDEAGNKALFQYDGLGHLLQVQTFRQPQPGQYEAYASTNFAYDDAGLVVEMVDAEGSKSQYAYDGLGRRIRSTYADGSLATTAYDDATNTVTETDPEGRVTVQERDWLDRVVQIRRPDRTSGRTAVEHIAYDALGREVQRIGPLGEVTDRFYDELGRQVKAVGPNLEAWLPGASAPTGLRRTLTTAYNDRGMAVARTSATGNALGGAALEDYTVRFAYDGLGRLLETREPFHNPQAPGSQSAGGSLQPARQERITRTFYDANGNVIREVDGRGQVKSFEYDARNRVVRETDGAGKVTTHRYSSTGKEIARTDPRGNEPGAVAGSYTTWFAYDEFGRLVTAILPDPTPPADPWLNSGDNPTVRFAYDRVGKLVRQVDPNGHETQYAYNSRHWLAKQTDPLGQVTTLEYNRVGQETRRQDPLGRVAEKAYDDFGQLVQEILHPAGGGPEQITRLEYDLAGRLSTRTDANGHRMEYSYDLAGNLAVVLDPLGHRTEYGYDPDGRRVRQVAPNGNVTLFAYNEPGWLVQVTQEATARQPRVSRYGYDLAGNLSWQVDPRGVVAEYAYDGRNLLQQVRYAGAVSAISEPTPPGLLPGTAVPRAEEILRYEYDAAGNRIQLTD